MTSASTGDPAAAGAMQKDPAVLVANGHVLHTGGARNVAALLTRGQASDTDWLARIDSLVRGGAARYRVAAPDSEVLTEIANDVTSPLEVRVGAGDEGRHAVRVAADTCADPKLRAALVELSAADSDEGVLEGLSRVSKG